MAAKLLIFSELCKTFANYFFYSTSTNPLFSFYLTSTSPSTLIELRTAHSCNFATSKLMPHPRLALTQKPSLFEIL